MMAGRGEKSWLDGTSGRGKRASIAGIGPAKNMSKKRQLKAKTYVKVGRGKRSPLNGMMGRGNQVWKVGMRAKKWNVDNRATLGKIS